MAKNLAKEKISNSLSNAHTIDSQHNACQPHENTPPHGPRPPRTPPPQSASTKKVQNSPSSGLVEVREVSGVDGEHIHVKVPAYWTEGPLDILVDNAPVKVHVPQGAKPGMLIGFKKSLLLQSVAKNIEENVTSDIFTTAGWLGASVTKNAEKGWTAFSSWSKKAVKAGASAIVTKKLSPTFNREAKINLKKGREENDSLQRKNANVEVDTSTPNTDKCDENGVEVTLEKEEQQSPSNNVEKSSIEDGESRDKKNQRRDPRAIYLERRIKRAEIIAKEREKLELKLSELKITLGENCWQTEMIMIVDSKGLPFRLDTDDHKNDCEISFKWLRVRCKQNVEKEGKGENDSLTENDEDIELLSDVTGTFYQPCADDIGCRFCVHVSGTGKFDTVTRILLSDEIQADPSTTKAVEKKLAFLSQDCDSTAQWIEFEACSIVRKKTTMRVSPSINWAKTKTFTPSKFLRRVLGFNSQRDHATSPSRAGGRKAKRDEEARYVLRLDKKELFIYELFALGKKKISPTPASPLMLSPRIQSSRKLLNNDKDVTGKWLDACEKWEKEDGGQIDENDSESSMVKEMRKKENTERCDKEDGERGNEEGGSPTAAEISLGDKVLVKEIVEKSLTRSAKTKSKNEEVRMKNFQTSNRNLQRVSARGDTEMLHPIFSAVLSLDGINVDGISISLDAIDTTVLTLHRKRITALGSTGKDRITYEYDAAKSIEIRLATHHERDVFTMSLRRLLGETCEGKSEEWDDIDTVEEEVESRKESLASENTNSSDGNIVSLRKELALERCLREQRDEELRHMQSAIKGLSKERENLGRELKSALNQTLTQYRESQNAAAKIERLSQRQRAMEKVAETERVEKENLLEMKAKYEALEQRMANFQENQKATEYEWSSAQASQKEIALKLQRELSGTKTAMQTLHRELQLKEDAVESAHDEVSRMAEEAKVGLAEIDALQNSVKEKDVELVNLKNENSRLTTRLTVLEQKNEEQIAHITKLEKEYNDQLVLKDAAQDAIKEKAVADDTINKLTGETNSLRQKLKSVTKELSKTRSRLKKFARSPIVRGRKSVNVERTKEEGKSSDRKRKGNGPTLELPENLAVAMKSPEKMSSSDLRKQNTQLKQIIAAMKARITELDEEVESLEDNLHATTQMLQIVTAEEFGEDEASDDSLGE
eukprot:g286.t1